MRSDGLATSRYLMTKQLCVFSIFTYTFTVIRPCSLMCHVKVNSFIIIIFIITHNLGVGVNVFGLQGTVK